MSNRATTPTEAPTEELDELAASRRPTSGSRPLTARRRAAGAVRRPSCGRAATPVPWTEPRQYLREVSSGNVSVAHFSRVVIGAVGRPVGRRLELVDRLPMAGADRVDGETLDLQPGERVEVRSVDEIGRTLDAGGRHRGLTFTDEMAQYCGKQFVVRRRVERIVDETSGRMLEFKKNACITLEDVICTGDQRDARLVLPQGQLPVLARGVAPTGRRCTEPVREGGEPRWLRRRPRTPAIARIWSTSRTTIPGIRSRPKCRLAPGCWTSAAVAVGSAAASPPARPTSTASRPAPSGQRSPAQRLRRVANGLAGPAVDGALDDAYDVIVFADVVEHIAEPEPVLRWAASKLSGDGQIIAMIPNSANWKFRRKMMVGDWSYEDKGYFDRDHLRFFDVRTVRQLGSASGLSEVSVAYVPERLPKPLNAWRKGAHAAADRWPNLFAGHVLVVWRQAE